MWMCLSGEVGLPEKPWWTVGTHLMKISDDKRTYKKKKKNYTTFLTYGNKPLALGGCLVIAALSFVPKQVKMTNNTFLLSRLTLMKFN